MKAQVKKNGLFDFYKNAIAETNPTMANKFLEIFLPYMPMLICIAHNTETEFIVAKISGEFVPVRNRYVHRTLEPRTTTWERG